MPVVSESRHISRSIARSTDDVYAYASDPTNLPRWASGLGSSVEHADGRWFVDSPGGRLIVAFAPRNDYGILDHEVTLPSGETVYNPMRVVADGDGCEVVFTLRTRPGMTEADFSRDADRVLADLDALKELLERG
jgi:polyketide cyclase/dehydrase/lipid transport protein